MYSPPIDSQSRGRQGARNVLRGDVQQNGVPYSGGQQQWGGNEGPQFQQYPSGDDSYQQYSDSGRGQMGASVEEVQNSKPFGELRNIFSQPTVQPSQSGVRLNARPGSTSYSAKKPTFRISTTATSELGDPGWIPKNKPPPHSQSRYMPATMRSPPVNRKHPEPSDNPDYHQSAGTPAWQGTLRSAGGPRAWEVHDQPPMSPSHSLDGDQWRNGGGRPQSGAGRRSVPPRPSPPRDESGEPRSARFYQLVNENNDQMEQYMKLPHRGVTHSTGGGGGGYSSTASYQAGPSPQY